MKIIIYHSIYGCDTGCCGHVIQLQDDNGKEIESKFDFFHPYGKNHLEFAKKLVEDYYGIEHVKDLDWNECRIIED